MTPAPISVDGAPAKVHRYDPRITPNLKTGRVDYDGMAAFPNGKWVLHSDYAALLQQLADYEMAATAESQFADERGETINQLRTKLLVSSTVLAEREAELEGERGVARSWQQQADRLESQLHSTIRRAEAAERAREEAFGVLRDIAEYKGDPTTPAHNSVKKSAIARAFLAAVDTAQGRRGGGRTMTPLALANALQNYVPVPESGCWLWLGRWTEDRYGRTSGRSGGRQAHRVFYESHLGQIPDGMFVCHKCDTPACVNPSHLFLGTHDENMRDMVMKRRSREARGESNSSAKLSIEDVSAIRASKETQKKLAVRYGVCPSSISHIRTGKRWNKPTDTRDGDGGRDG